MLFDLSSPRRKRVIRVVYGLLAFLFFIGFVGFGIGGEIGSGGGLLDAIGLTDDSGGGSAGEAAEDQISAAEEKLAADPRNDRALADLVLARLQFGNALAETDDAGNVIPTDESFEQWKLASADFQRYLDLDPARPDAAAAGQLLNLYDLLLADAYDDVLAGTAEPAALQAVLDDATATAKITSDGNPSQGTFATLARFAYLAGDTKTGDKAGKQAFGSEGDVPKGQLKKTLEGFEKQGKQAQQSITALEKTAGGKQAGQDALQNPFGGLGGGAAAP